MGGGEGEEGEDKDRGARERVVLTWGYLPGASPQRSPQLSPEVVRLPESFRGDAWRNVCGGGCGFAMATSVSGKLITWGSTDDLGQSYVTSGRHEETPEAFPLPAKVSIMNAAAGWAHCTAVTGRGEVYTWGWRECVPAGKVMEDQPSMDAVENELFERQSGALTDQVSPRSQLSKGNSGVLSGLDMGTSEDGTKRRRLSPAKQSSESSPTSVDAMSAVPCLVTLSVGVRIISVAAGGRHTLALSDVGQVWGWGYGGEGQLGLGTRVRIVTSPHPIPCVESSSYNKGVARLASKAKAGSDGRHPKIAGTIIKAIACGGRHSVIVTDNGTLLTFGWGLYGQLGQGRTDDELSPTCVTSLLGTNINGIAAGLWHTVCVSADGNVYAFGGNQFGQLGTGVDQLELYPKILRSDCLENKVAKIVSCGARHSAIMTEKGEVFCWGWNKYGQLGLGDSIDRSAPSLVPINSYLLKNISCGWWHTLALAESPR